MYNPTTDNTASINSPSSAVAWPAIWAGAFAALTLSLILSILGAGISAASLPTSDQVRASATALTSGVVIWLIFTQWLASGFGGYLAGRLRTKYISVHTDEVFFRDTAHGFLAWAVATVIAAAFFAAAFTSTIGAGAHIVGGAATAAMARPGPEGPMAGPGEANAYAVDGLFRSDQPQVPVDPQTRGEVMRIILTGLKNGDVSQADRNYLAGQIVVRERITPAEASKRVDDAITQVKAAQAKALETAETARKAAAKLSIFTALSLFVGAFIASVGGALGGKRRDEY